MTLNLFHQPPMSFNDFIMDYGLYDEDDVIDLLPPDPFGMNMDPAFTTILWNKSMKLPMEHAREQPHEALNYVLGYLGVKELVTVERVCKSLRSTVKDDPLLWRNICIESDRIGDDALFKLTGRAQGNLRHLSLLKCLRVTNKGLERVLETNPRIEKLSVPECIGLDVDLIVKSLEKLNRSGMFDLKYLRLGGRYDVTMKHYENLKELLHMKDYGQTKPCRPRIYHGRLPSLHDDDGDDNAIIDIERCSRCENIRLIFDCPMDKCHTVEHSSDKCRACINCITRCFQCGQCLDDGYIETFDFEGLCLYCFEQQPETVHVSSSMWIVE